MAYSTFTMFCNQNYFYLVPKYFYNPKWKPYPLSSQSPSPIPRQPLNWFMSPWIYLSWMFHINRLTYVILCPALFTKHNIWGLCTLKHLSVLHFFWPHLRHAKVHTCAMQKVPGQESNPNHSSDDDRLLTARPPESSSTSFLWLNEISLYSYFWLSIHQLITIGLFLHFW